MQLPIADQALHRENLPAIRLHCEHSARFHRLSVKNYSACSAMTCIAPDVTPCQSQHLTYEVNQQQPRLDFAFAVTAIYFHVNQLFLCHRHLLGSYLLALSAARVTARLASSLTSPFLYSAGPRKSELGCASSAANCAACRTFASSS